MGEVSDMFSVNASLIRFWEKEFKLIQPKKNKKGNRIFTPKDISHFNNIYQLVKIEGYTLEGAKTALTSKSFNKVEENSFSDVISKLESIKEKLILLKS